MYTTTSSAIRMKSLGTQILNLLKVSHLHVILWCMCALQLLQCSWLHLSLTLPESEEEVEELEERVNSPEVQQEEAAAFYEQSPW